MVVLVAEFERSASRRVAENARASAVLGLTLFAVGYLLHALTTDTFNVRQTRSQT